MRVVIAPDKFKGRLTAAQAADAIENPLCGSRGVNVIAATPRSSIRIRFV